jgi:dihydroorotase
MSSHPDRLTLRRPDDWHLHLRDGPALPVTVAHSARHFGRAIIMPNLSPPVTSVAQADAYAERIRAHIPRGSGFTPLLTLYLTDTTPVDEIARIHASEQVYACKLYPAGATTNSANGVTDMTNIHAVLEAMQHHDIPLLVHGEVTDASIDIFDREKAFIERHLQPIHADFPELRIVFEHITTADAVAFVQAASARVAATVTPQHLLLNRNALLAGGIQPHNYCLPVLKRETHRRALLSAATSGNPKFFLGSDSAPHARSAKETACGCAGIYSAPIAIELYAEAFSQAQALDRLGDFSSRFGADFYGLPPNDDSITLVTGEWTVPATYRYLDEDVVPFMAGQTLHWRVAD